jgi:hypothetical protein
MEALELVENTGERYHEALLYRSKGDLMRAQDRGVEAETNFRTAIRIAQIKVPNRWNCSLPWTLHDYSRRGPP